MNYDQDLAIYIPESSDFTSFHGLPTPPTEPISSNQSSDPPTHKPLTPLDRVGGTTNPIGPRRRQRRSARTPQQQARSVARRNARERKRVKLVNMGFATLRDHIPPHMGLNAAPAAQQPTANKNSKSSNNKKLSKVETLRCAIEYIRQLREAVGYDDKDMMDMFDDKDMYDDKGGSGGSVEGFSPAETESSCNTPSPVMMLTNSPSLFDDEDENDDFFNIVDWTNL